MFSKIHVDSSVGLVDSTSTVGTSTSGDSSGNGGLAGNGTGNGENIGGAHATMHSISVRNSEGQSLSLTHTFNDDAMVTSPHGMFSGDDHADLPANVDDTRLLAQINAAHLAAAARAEVLPDNWQTAAALVGSAVLVGAYASRMHRKRIAMMTRGFDAQIDD